MFKEVLCVVSEPSLTLIAGSETDYSDDEEVIITSAPRRRPEIMRAKV